MDAEIQLKEIEKSPAKSKLPEFLTEEYRSKFGSLLELSKAQKDKIKKRLKREISEWKQNTGDLHKNLEEINDLLEGVVEETDYPWVGASCLHIPITAIYCKVYHSIERRSILGGDIIWYTETNEDALEDYTSRIDDSLNYFAKSEWNIVEGLSEVFQTTNRDGLGVLQIPYVEDYEKTKDVLFISNVDEFMQEFPDAESSGLSQEEWEITGQYIADNANEDFPVEIPITYDKPVYVGPKAEVVELVDFVTFPATARNITRQNCRGYGKRFTMRRGEIKKKRDEGVWDKEETTKLLSETRSGTQASSYVQSKDRAEGLGRDGKSDDYEFFELVYYIELKKGDGEEKLLLTYSYEEDALTAFIDYPYRIDFYALFRIEKKPNRLIGASVPGQLMEMNKEIDTQHNQRIQSREIATVPSFKGKKSAFGKDFDLEAEENRFHPGVLFLMDDPEGFEQFKVQPTDMGESMNEEKNDIQICSLTVGVDAFLFSGNAQSSDPNAPGNKTVALINQSNLRMDDPINELRSGVETAGEICLSHLYQFGPAQLEYFASEEGGKRQRQSIPKRILRKGIKVKMHGVTVAMNPDSEFQKWYNYYLALVKEPVIGQSAKRRVEILRRALRGGRIPGRDKILPSIQEIEQEEIQMRMKVQQAQQQQMAMQQQQVQQQAAIQQQKAMEQAKAAGIKNLANRVRTNALVSRLKEQIHERVAPGAQGNGG